MIVFKYGNALDDDAEVLVNPVNCAGVISTTFGRLMKTMYAENCLAYQSVCANGELTGGRIQVNKTDGRFVINLPTRDYPNNISDMDYINRALMRVVEFINLSNAKTICIPKLVDGDEDLHWPTIKNAIVTSLKSIANDVDIRVYENDDSYYDVIDKKQKYIKTLNKLVEVSSVLSDKFDMDLQMIVGLGYQHLTDHYDMAIDSDVLKQRIYNTDFDKMTVEMVVK